VEAHYRACLYSGLEISGTNAEVMPAQVIILAKVMLFEHLKQSLSLVGIPSWTQ